MSGSSGPRAGTPPSPIRHDRPGDAVGRLLGLVALVWSVDGALFGWAAYSHAHALPGTDFAFWFVARLGAFLNQ